MLLIRRFFCAGRGCVPECLRPLQHPLASPIAMATSSTLPGMFLSQVLRRRTPCSAHFELTLGLAGFPPASPGQFLEVLCRAPQADDDSEPQPSARAATELGIQPPRQQHGAMLRRPFSIAALRRSAHGCEIDLLGRVTGEGTAWLAARRPGDSVDVLGPLGRGFSTPTDGSRVLLVAGGIGLPPIRWLGEELRKKNLACDVVYGALSRDLLPVKLSREPASGELSPCVEEFAQYGINTLLTTDDGSCGMRGQVTDGIRRYCESVQHLPSVRVYACGSEAMLRAIASFCAQRGMPCEVAMERKMACGMGTCQSCVVPVIDRKSESGWRYALCCTEGPVFGAAEVCWPRVAC